MCIRAFYDRIAAFIIISMKSALKNFFARKSVRWILGIVVIIILGSFLFKKNGQITYETATIARGTVIEQVTTTGQVKPKDFASLKFKTTGTISRLAVDVGDTVYAGQTLAALDAGELAKKVTQAEADLVAAEVDLANANQDVLDQKVKGDQALAVIYAGLPSSFSTILNSVEQAYATFISFFDSSGRLDSSISNAILSSQRVTDANNAVTIAKTALATMRAAIENFPPASAQTAIDAALLAIHDPLYDLQAALNALINAVAAIPTGSISATTLATYKEELTTARTNLNTALTTEADEASDLRDAKVQNTLNLNAKQAAQRLAQANLEKAKATLEIARENASDAYIRAPFAGTVAVKSKQIGELVTTADQVYYVIGEGGLEVVANIPEVDIAKVSVGDSATIELDAYEDGTVFTATVAEIDPAETVVDGITTYRVTFALAETTAVIRSGMTANIAIETERRENVLVIPQRALVVVEGGRAVRLPPATPDAEPTEVPVQTGLRGNGGLVEVLSGVTEGMTIIVGIK